MREIYYRAEDTQHAGDADEWGDTIPGSAGPLSIQVMEIPVRRRTEFGVVLDMPNGAHNYRFVHEGRTKRFAHPTKKEALEALAARRERQAAIYRARAAHADQVAAVTRAMLARDVIAFYGSRYEQERTIRRSAERPEKVAE